MSGSRMQTRAREIFASVKRELKRGAGNYEGASKELKNDITFIQDIRADLRHELKSMFKEIKLNKEDYSREEFSWLFWNIFTATMCLLYQCGNCGDQAAVVLMHYLENGIWSGEKLEYVHLRGSNDIDHAFILLNRDTKTDLSEQWVARNKDGIIKIDTWDDKDILIFKNNYIPSSLNHVTPYIKEVKQFETTAFDRDLHANEWKQIIFCLDKVKIYLRDYLLKSYGVSNSEMAKIINQIDKKIKSYEEILHRHSHPIDARFFHEAKSDSKFPELKEDHFNPSKRES